MTPKEIRLASGLSLERAAVAAGVTSPTIRLFEADPSAAPRVRPKLEAFYATLAARITASAAATSPQKTNTPKRTALGKQAQRGRKAP